MSYQTKLSIYWHVSYARHLISDYYIFPGLSYTHMATPMPEAYRRERYVPRGVSNRRAALQWVQENGEDSGVLYFLDDDNAIDIRLFNEMRSTQTVSMWPVGLIGDYTVSSPVIRNVSFITLIYLAELVKRTSLLQGWSEVVNFKKICFCFQRINTFRESSQ